ncbi:MAG: L,D-transpeptidase [Niameybacter sp.]
MKKIYLVIFFCFLFTTSLCASESTSILGTLSSASIQLEFESQKVTPYTALELDYIPVSTLRQLGFPVDYDQLTSKITIHRPNQILLSDTSTLTLVSKPYTVYDAEIWIDGFKTHGIICEGNVLIPIGALRQLFHIEINDTTYKMTPKEPLHITATANLIENNLPTPISISLIDLYWDNGFIMQPSHYDVAPLETLSRSTNTLHNNKRYITTLIKSATGRELNYTNESMFGQTNGLLFDNYTRMNLLADLDLGDPIDFATLVWAESTVNTKSLSSKTPYLVWTNIDLQSTFIFEGSKGNWQLIKHFLCSTGKTSSPTPKGSFALTHKVPYFGLEKGYRCKNAFGFIGTTYLYHSVMFDKSGSYLLQGKGDLGQRASAGCIRLSVEHSEWFYNNMINGTTVLID